MILKGTPKLPQQTPNGDHAVAIVMWCLVEHIDYLNILTLLGLLASALFLISYTSL